MQNLKTARNVLLYTIGEIIPRILSFLLLPLLTKYLTTSDYGISSYINTVITFLYALTTLSINSYVLRTYYKAETENARKKLIGNAFMFLCVWGLVMLCLESLFFPVLLNVFSIKVPFYPYFLLGLVINFFDVASVIPLITYRVSENAKGFVILSVGRTITQYIFIIILIVFFKMGLQGSFLGRFIACIPFFLIYLAVIKKRGEFLLDIRQIKEALHFSLPLLPGALSYLVISMLDRVVLEKYVSLSSLGIYSVASTLSLTLNIVIQGLYRSFEQKIFREHSANDFIEKTDKLYKAYIAALFIPGFAVALFSKELLLFFTTSQYYSASNYVGYLVISVIISGINTFLGTLLIADNKRTVISKSSFTAAIFSIIINVVLIKNFYVIGACIASMLSFLTVSVFYFSKTRMLKKYLPQQVFFTLFFILIQVIHVPAFNLVFSIILKLTLFTGFSLLVISTLKIRLPSLTILSPKSLIAQYRSCK